MVDYNEQWLLGDIVKDAASDREGKIVKLGEGESVFHRERSGLIVCSHHGDEWILIQFTEKTTKVKQGKKWVTVPGKKEDLWIKITSQDFRNMSEIARRKSFHRDSSKNNIATSIECDHDDCPFLEWEDHGVEDDTPVDEEVAETSMEATSSSSSSSSSNSVPSDGARKRDAPPKVSSRIMVTEVSTLSYSRMNTPSVGRQQEEESEKVSAR